MPDKIKYSACNPCHCLVSFQIVLVSMSRNGKDVGISGIDLGLIGNIRTGNIPGIPGFRFGVPIGIAPDAPNYGSSRIGTGMQGEICREMQGICSVE
jgi:hypothetical protein